MSELVIGLTGGIGSGKTAVSDRFAARGIEIIDADIIAREVVEPGTSALQHIAEKFGADILDRSGALDRRALRERVFTDKDAKDWLNQLLHPLIRQEMLRQTHQASSLYCILSVPLLVENGLDSLVDRVLVVDVDEKQQLERASNRDGQTQEQVQHIMNAQASRAERLDVAHEVIDNSGTLAQLDGQVDALHQQYLNVVKNLSKG